jgi:hypothetical protein
VPFGDFFSDRFRQGVKHRIRLFQRHMGPGCDQMGQFLFANDLGGLGICCGHKLVAPFSEWSRHAGGPAAALSNQSTERLVLDHSLFCLYSCELSNMNTNK